MKKGAIIALSVLGVLVLAGAGGFWYLSKPVEAATYADPVNQASRESNTELKTALSIAGIESSFVSVQDGQVYVGYDVPADSERSVDDWQRIVLGTAAAVVPDSQSLVARAFVDEQPATEWSVATAKVLEYQNDEITGPELEDAVTKTDL